MSIMEVKQHCLMIYFIIFQLIILKTNSEICTSTICEYTFEISLDRTMTYTNPETAQTYDVALNGTNLQVIENSHKVKEYDPFIGTFVSNDDVITADGYQRDVITINGQFPGPTIEIMHKAQVVVNVVNKLPLQGTTIHWHGLHMKETPWMDGAAYVTQCPIMPKQMFTYRFIADPVGTHWYHAHIHTQRMDGLFGMLIVHDTPPRLPSVVVNIMDWQDIDASALHVQNPSNIDKSGSGHSAITVPNRGFMHDNNGITQLKFHSALINGKGRYNDRPYPLTVFKFKAGQRYRFRLAHTGAEQFFEVSIDNHNIVIIALDGTEIVPLQVDSFILYPGETIDFEVDAKSSPSGNYWLRADLAISGYGRNPTPGGFVPETKAIISYNDNKNYDDPTTSKQLCSTADPCKVFNCPFGFYKPSLGKTCLHLTDAQSQLSQEYLDETFGINEDVNNIEEYMFNFAFLIGPSVNARKYIAPRAPLFSPDIDQYITKCDVDACNSIGCKCTHIQNIPGDKVIQIVLVNYTPGAGYMAPHTVHLHGHSFAVLKMGFAAQNETTGFWTEHNPDILCSGNICSRPRWNGGWPDLNKNKPPIKDSVIVPARGYVVIRYRSGNSGFWMLHCHQEMHMIAGMAMVLNEGPDMHRPLPDGFPTCEDFKWTEEKFQQYRQNNRTGWPVTPTEPSPTDKGNSNCVDNTDKDTGAGDTPPSAKIILDQNTAIGTAFGLVLLGAVISVVPTMIHYCCSKKK